MAEMSTAAIEPYLSKLWECGATDLLITADAVPFMRVDGSLSPVDGASLLTASEAELLIKSLLGSELSARLEAEREVDLSFAWGEWARFRANAFYQRGSI